MDHDSLTISEATGTNTAGLNGTDATLNSLKDQDAKTVSASASIVVQDNVVFLEIPKGLFTSGGGNIGGVNYGGMSVATDSQGRQLLPLSASLISQCSSDGLSDRQGTGLLDSHGDSDGMNLCDQSLDTPDAVSSSELHLTTAVTPLTTSGSQEEMKQKRKGGWPKGKKRKNTPDLNTPRAPISGYVLYAIERRQAIKESNPDLSFVEITKILGQEWSTMVMNKKQKYLDEAEADKKRYIEELKAFQQSEPYQMYIKKKKMKAREANGLETADSYLPLIDLEEDYINELYCHVCNQYFSSLHNKKEHMFGRQHLQAITGELEKEMQKQCEQQQVLSGNSLLVGELNSNTLCPLSDGCDLPDSPQPHGPVDIEAFIQEFLQRNLERNLEIRQLGKSLKEAQLENFAMCKQIQELKHYETKLTQDISYLKSYGASLTAQVDGLKMVPTLFGVINF